MKNIIIKLYLVLTIVIYVNSKPYRERLLKGSKEDQIEHSQPVDNTNGKPEKLPSTTDEQELEKVKKQMQDQGITLPEKSKSVVVKKDGDDSDDEENVGIIYVGFFTFFFFL